MRNRKNNPLLLIINNLLIDLPTPINLSYFWNYGSLLGLFLIIQILTGVLLAMHYCPDSHLAFSSINHICRNINFGFLLKNLHANGASLLFIFLYLHIGRALYYGSYNKIALWFSGIILFLFMMIIAFMGYVLPWGQMSFWGATVITNFLSAIPYFGVNLVQWLWGGFSVGNPTLTRFFSLHYLFPFILIGIIIIHLNLLHIKGSNSPLGLNNNLDKIPFHVYYTIKDLFGFIISLFFFSILFFFFPNLLGDPENFIKANSLVTPVHIMPEWYFLFAYAILRAIPNKLGGVLALLFSILILFILPILNFNIIKSSSFNPINKIIYFFFIINFFLLTWIGSKPVESPFILIGQICSIFYFFYFLFLLPFCSYINNILIYKIL